MCPVFRNENAAISDVLVFPVRFRAPQIGYDLNELPRSVLHRHMMLFIFLSLYLILSLVDVLLLLLQ